MDKVSRAPAEGAHNRAIEEVGRHIDQAQAGPHTDLDDLLSFINDPGTLKQDEQLHIARHLSAGCATCWSAVDELPSIEPFRPSETALREALIHLSCNESRAILSADLVDALARVRDPATGFARLLLIETHSICIASKEGVHRDAVCDDLVNSLLNESDGPASPELLNLSIQNQIHQTMAFLQANQAEDADIALKSALLGASSTTLDPAVFVSLCEAQSRWAWHHDDLASAVTHYRQAFTRLDEITSTRLFEIHGEIAILHVLLGELDEMSMAEEKARAALIALRAAGDPVLATGAVLRDAELTQRLAVHLLAQHPARLPDVRQAVDSLQAAEDDFERFTDGLAQAQRDYCLARLTLFLDPKEAETLYYRAAKSFRKCQAEDYRNAALMEGGMIHGLRNLRSLGIINGQWTTENLKSLFRACSHIFECIKEDAEDEIN